VTHPVHQLARGHRLDAGGLWVSSNRPERTDSRLPTITRRAPTTAVHKMTTSRVPSCGDMCQVTAGQSGRGNGGMIDDDKRP
jgi:hypothetical protein